MQVDVSHATSRTNKACTLQGRIRWMQGPANTNLPLGRIGKSIPRHACMMWWSSCCYCSASMHTAYPQATAERPSCHDFCRPDNTAGQADKLQSQQNTSCCTLLQDKVCTLLLRKIPLEKQRGCSHFLAISFLQVGLSSNI